MPTPNEILKEMDNILTELIGTAEQLQNMSRQVVSKDELIRLQKSQKELVDQLSKLDEAFKKAFKGEQPKENSTYRQEIEKKLEIFENLNANFIENLTGSQPFIKVAKSKSKK